MMLQEGLKLCIWMEARPETLCLKTHHSSKDEVAPLIGEA